jgi:hypothetical protein
MKYFNSIVGLSLLMLACSMRAEADGLSTPFVNVELNSVVPGHSLHVHDSEGHGLRIKNLGSSPVLVSIEVLIPQPSQLWPGAGPIPDVQWIQVQPRELELGAHEEKETELVLKVPRKKAYRGGYFQAMIWSHGVPSSTQGMTISAGLLSKLRFRIKE